MAKFIAVLPVALTLVGLYGGYCGLLFLLQRSLVFPGTSIRERSSGSSEYPQHEVIWLSTSFGQVESWYFQAEGVYGSSGDPSAGPHPVPAVLIAHGNAELIDDLALPFLRFTELGFAVFLVEYPGYGRSQGSPSQATVTETLVAAYDVLADRPEVDRGRIIALGRSLGGAAVCALAAERPLRSLVLLSTFTSLRAMARRFFVPGFLARDPFDNLRVLQSYQHPVLVVHGTEDGLIPHAHGERLAAAAPDAQLVSYRCGHNDCPPDWDQFWEDVQGFLRRADLLTRGDAR